MCDRAAVVASAGGDQRAHRRLVAQRAFDSPRRAQYLESRQPEPAGLVLDLDSGDAQFRCDGVELVNGRGRVAGQGAVESGGGVAWRGDRCGVQRRIDDGSHAQKRVARLTSVRATASVSARLTHSSMACAPSPPGPNRTVGMPAAAMKAASAQ